MTLSPWRAIGSRPDERGQMKLMMGVVGTHITAAAKRFNQSCLCVLQVSSLFKDGTIGGNINIVIVGLVLLDEEQVTASKPIGPLRLQAVHDN